MIRRIQLFLLGCLTAVISVPVSNPFLVSEEAGFILNAYRITGRGSPSGLGSFPAYSVLLSPVSLLTTSLRDVTAVTQMANGILAGLSAIVAYSVLRRLSPTASDLRLMLMSLVIVCFPAYRVFASLALAENLMILLSLTLTNLAMRASERADTGSTAALGLLGGLSVAIDPRAIVVPVAVLIVLVFRMRTNRRLLGAGVSGLLAGMGLSAIGVWLVVGADVSGGTGEFGAIGTIIANSLDVTPLTQIPQNLITEIWYLLCASASLIALGAHQLFVEIRRPDRNSPPPPRSVGALMAASLGALWLIPTALVLVEGFDGPGFSGRFLEASLAPVLLWGVSAVSESPRRSARTMQWSSFSIMALALLGLALGGPSQLGGRAELLNFAAVYPLIERDGAVLLSSISVAGVIATALVFWLAKGRRALHLPTLIIAFVLIAAFDVRTISTIVADFEEQDFLLHDIEAFFDAGQIECVGFDRSGLEQDWHQAFLRLEMLDHRTQNFASLAGEEPCSPLVISTRADLDSSALDALVVEVDVDSGQFLWLLPGDLQQRTMTERRLLSDPDKQLAEDQSILVDIRITSELPAEDRSTVEGTVYILNRGPDALVPLRRYVESNRAVNIGLGWRDPTDPSARPMEPLRLRLPRIIFPGEFTEVPFRIRLDAVGSNTPDSPRLLVAEVVQEGTRWTGQQGEAWIELIIEDTP